MGGGATSAGGAPVVHTVNYPLMYFAERIGGDHVDVRFLAPDGDPRYKAAVFLKASSTLAAVDLGVRVRVDAEIAALDVH